MCPSIQQVLLFLACPNIARVMCPFIPQVLLFLSYMPYSRRASCATSLGPRAPIFSIRAPKNMSPCQPLMLFRQSHENTNEEAFIYVKLILHVRRGTFHSINRGRER
ncbi:hypothetical protein AMTR_s00080p00066750 [Amborella trichopoda]|uniref:Uncharacterized protein n=1 Tax=Amborella trichopoda TaxID=13333 RepID=W1PAE6_AMBTC|nr:hypothetical protein AMTR_s00080p00066750 [Amborella trichopoda]